MIEGKPKVDMNSKEVKYLMQHMKYVGFRELSKTQVKKERSKAAESFFQVVMAYHPQEWQKRYPDAVWRFGQEGGDWKLENWQDPRESKLKK